jgi:hypothetical protein
MLTNTQRNEFENATKPLIKWLSENCNPHAQVVVDSTSAELFEGIMSFNYDEFLKD